MTWRIDLLYYWISETRDERGKRLFSDGYSIEDLADESGFDKRVIRSFIEQGLVRGPDSKGRYARYTRAHLIRLQAIKYLRETREMSLNEIRLALLSMSEEDIRALSLKTTQAKNRVVKDSSVLDYLRAARSPQSQSINQSQSRATTLPSTGPSVISQSNSGQSLSAVDRLMAALNTESNARRLSSQSKAQRWHRFSVTPDIELSVRGLQDGGQIEQWDRVAESLREILLGGTKHE